MLVFSCHALCSYLANTYLFKNNIQPASCSALLKLMLNLWNTSEIRIQIYMNNSLHLDDEAGCSIISGAQFVYVHVKGIFIFNLSI